MTTTEFASVLRQWSRLLIQKRACGVSGTVASFAIVCAVFGKLARQNGGGFCDGGVCDGDDDDDAFVLRKVADLKLSGPPLQSCQVAAE